MRHHLVRLASAPFISFRLAKFGWVPFADLRMQRLATKQNAEFTEGARKLLPIFTPLWTKVHKNLEQCVRPLVLSNAVARLFTSRIIYKIFVIKCRRRRKPNKRTSFWPPIFLETSPTYLQQIVSAMCCPPFGKVWLSFVCLPPSAKPDNEVESRIYVGWVKMGVPI